MREQVLWRKVARIIMRLAERLQISPERALAIFYDTRTCSMLHDIEGTRWSHARYPERETPKNFNIPETENRRPAFWAASVFSDTSR